MTEKERAALQFRYPCWKDNIANGDFGVFEDLDGKKHVEWTNTFVFHPNLKELEIVILAEFPGRKPQEIVFLSGIMSLSITTRGLT